jgi:hypothetical protein
VALNGAADLGPNRCPNRQAIGRIPTFHAIPSQVGNELSDERRIRTAVADEARIPGRVVTTSVNDIRSVVESSRERLCLEQFRPAG